MGGRAGHMAKDGWFLETSKGGGWKSEPGKSKKSDSRTISAVSTATPSTVSSWHLQIVKFRGSLRETMTGNTRHFDTGCIFAANRNIAAHDTRKRWDHSKGTHDVRVLEDNYVDEHVFTARIQIGSKVQQSRDLPPGKRESTQVGTLW